jgi:hypothetical protein
LHHLPVLLKFWRLVSLLVLNDESRRNAEIETHQQTALLIDEIAAHEVTSKDLQDARI